MNWEQGCEGAGDAVGDDGGSVGETCEGDAVSDDAGSVPNSVGNQRVTSLLSLGFTRVVTEVPGLVRRDIPLQSKRKRKKASKVTGSPSQRGDLADKVTNIRKYLVPRRLISAKPEVVLVNPIVESPPLCTQ